MDEEQSAQPESQPTPAASSGGDDKLMAALSYIWIVSVVMLLTKKDSEFVQFHAKQATVLFGISVIIWILSIPLVFLWLVSWIVYLVLFVAAAIGFIKAYSGERYRIPLIADLADKINI